MEREVLKRYFERTSSEAEMKTVESWLLDPSNKVTFENFLEEEWHEHTKTTTRASIVGFKKTTSKLIWRAASVAALLLLTFGAYQLLSVSPQKELSTANVVPVQQEDPLQHTPLSSLADPLHVSDTTIHFQPKIVQHAKKKTVRQSQAIVAQTDTSNQQIKAKSVPARTLTKAKINEDAIAGLIQKIDSNQLVLNVNLSEVDFKKLAYIFSNEYGIVLELCNSADMDKTYTAKFKKISIHDLLDDMSEKMAFTYSFQDNKVKICFN